MKTWLIPIETLRAKYTRLLDEVDPEAKNSLNVEVHLKYLLANTMEPALFEERMDELADDLGMFGIDHMTFECIVADVRSYFKTQIVNYTGLSSHLFEGNWHLDFKTRTLSVSAYC
ncbi:hypothetical protein TOTORO_00220 [Serratia phage vB_SmaS-Totoro]|nr:hypothetical protein TOTORO_00220 [Serratia phage vB_SmaS-Totoro]